MGSFRNSALFRRRQPADQRRTCGRKASAYQQNHARILIVEETRAMAAAMAVLVENAGHLVVAVVQAVDDLACFLSDQIVDFAIVDQSGGGAFGTRAAAALHSAGIPFAFVGGAYADVARPAGFASVPRLGPVPWDGEVLGTINAYLADRGRERGVEGH